MIDLASVVLASAISAVAATPATPAAPPAPAAPAAPVAQGPKVRVAVPEFRVEGGGTPALSLQLQDGFVLGLVRAGVEVLDPVDTARRLEKTPELAGCDSSACLKNIGRTLEAKFVVRVKVDVAGNSYKMVARLFSTEGAMPAALPISTKSRNCDVCTVDEARDHMLRLADALKPEVEATLLAPRPVPDAAAPSLVPPVLAAVAGAAAVATGVVLFLSLPGCAEGPAAPPCDHHRGRSAIAGGLVGAGVVVVGLGTYVTVTRLRTPAAGHATTMVALTMRF